MTVSRATISRYLQAHGLVTPEPKKWPKSSYIRFQAAMPNQTSQSDFTHYRLRRPDERHDADTEILTWFDDCSRYAPSVTAHHRVTGTIVVATFRATVAEHGIPVSTLTDNGMVFTTGYPRARKAREPATGSRPSSDDSGSSRRTPPRASPPPAGRWRDSTAILS